MKRVDEVTDYTNNKKQIFNQLVSAIDGAHKRGETKVYLKGVKIMEETIDVIAKQEEWITVLEKARKFFEGLEDYETCGVCQKVIEKIKEKRS